jgi:hypothetical protein
MVDGSSGQATFGSMDHPAMYSSILQLGSVILDIDGNRLVSRFVRETGEIQDTFTMVKETPDDSGQVPRITDTKAVAGWITLTWNSQPGVCYVVQRAASLTSQWEDVSEVLSAQGSVQSWKVQCETGVPARFYRIAIVR